MKKKILLISESMGGGLRKHVVQLIENLDHDKFEIFFIHGIKTMDDAFVNHYETLKKFATIIPCPSFEREINPRKDLESYLFLVKVIKEIRPDIVHCHSSKAGVIGRLAAKQCGVKKVFYTPHAYSFLAPEFSERKKKIFILIERFLSRHATTQTFCVSKGEKASALLYKLDRNEKFSVIYNGLPDIKLPTKNEVKQRLGLKATDIVIGNNARMSEQKNPFLFMRIAKDLITKDSSYHFVWAGDGPLMNDVKNFIQDNRIEDNVHLLGDRKDSELIVAGYDVFLITSLYEGLPYAPIEALRVGVPILATDVVGNKEIVDYNNGILFDLDDKKKAVDIILNKNKLEILDKESIIYSFKKKFSLNNMKMEIERNYNE